MNNIEKETLKFLKLLATNNNKPWFEGNRSKYDAAKLNFIDFVSEIIKGVSSFDPRISGLEAKKTIFRINRDVRFSKNKSPYKSNFGSTLSAGGKNMQTAGYYFQLQPGNKSFAGAGSYMPIPENLAKIRQEIDYNYKAFHKIVTAANFKKEFGGLSIIEVLKTTPKGYLPDNPAIEYLKHKSFIVSRTFTDKEVLAPDFQKTLLKSFKISQPLVQFINNAIED